MAPSASLVVIKRSGGDGQRYILDDRHWCTIGSHPECDIIIHSKGVAKLHALVRVTDVPTGASSVFGLDQDLPTVVPNKKTALYKDDGTSLAVGDHFFVGERAFRFEIAPAEPARVLVETTASRASSRTNVVPAATNSSRDPSAETTPAVGHHHHHHHHHQDRRRRRSSLVVKDASEEFVSVAKTQSLLTAHRLSLSAERVVSDFFKAEEPVTEPASKFKSSQCPKPTLSKATKSPLKDTQQNPVSAICRRMSFENPAGAHSAGFGSELLQRKVPDLGAPAVAETQTVGENHGPAVGNQEILPSRIARAAQQATPKSFRATRPSQIPSTLRKPTFASAARSRPQVARNSPFLARRPDMNLERREDPASIALGDENSADFSRSDDKPNVLKEENSERLCTPKRLARPQYRTELRPPKRAMIHGISHTAPRSIKFRTLSNAHLSTNLPETASPRRLNFTTTVNAEEKNNARLLTPKRVHRNEASAQALTSTGSHSGSFYPTPAPVRESGPKTRSSSEKKSSKNKKSELFTGSLPGYRSEIPSSTLFTPIHGDNVPETEIDSGRPGAGSETVPIITDASTEQLDSNSGDSSADSSRAPQRNASPQQMDSNSDESSDQSSLARKAIAESFMLSTSNSSPIRSIRAPASDEAHLQTTSPLSKVELADSVDLERGEDSAGTELLFAGVKFSVAKVQRQGPRALPPRAPKTESHVRVLRKRPVTPPKQILRRSQGGAVSELHVRHGSGIAKERHTRSRAGSTPSSRRTVLFADALGADIELASGPHYSPHVKRSLQPELNSAPVRRTTGSIPSPRFDDNVPTNLEPPQINENQPSAPREPVLNGIQGVPSQSPGENVILRPSRSPSLRENVMPRPSPVNTEKTQIADTSSVDSVLRALGPPPSTPLGILGSFFYPVRPHVLRLTAPTPRKLIEAPPAQYESSETMVVGTSDTHNLGSGDEVSNSNICTPRRRSFPSIPGFASAMGLMRRFSASSESKADNDFDDGDMRSEDSEICNTMVNPESKSAGHGDVDDENIGLLDQLGSPIPEAHTRPIADQPSEETLHSEDVRSSDNNVESVTVSDPNTPRRQSLLGRAVSAVVAVASTPVHAVFGSRGRAKSLEASCYPSDSVIERDPSSCAIADELPTDSRENEDSEELGNSLGHAEAVQELVRENDISTVSVRIAEEGCDICSPSTAPGAVSRDQETRTAGNFEKWTVKELREYLGGLGKPQAGLRKTELIKLAQSTVMVPEEFTEHATGEDPLSPRPKCYLEPKPERIGLSCRGSAKKKFTVERLRKELDDLGLPTTGRKADLLERLEVHSALVSSPSTRQLVRPTLGVHFETTTTCPAEDHSPVSRPKLQVSDETLTFLTVRELRELLREQGLPSDGRKPELITRLQRFEKESPTTPKSVSEKRSKVNDLAHMEASSEVTDKGALPTVSETDLNMWTVVELRAELKRRGLVTAGKKPDLISRLEDALQGADVVASENEKEDAGKLSKSIDVRKMSASELREVLLEHASCAVGSKAVLQRRAEALLCGRRRTRDKEDILKCERCQANKTCEAMT